WTISNRPRRDSRDGTLPLRKCPALAYGRTRRSLRAIQSLRTDAARDRAARDRRSEKSANRQQRPGALSPTYRRARPRLAAGIFPGKSWGRYVNLAVARYTSRRLSHRPQSAQAFTVEP